MHEHTFWWLLTMACIVWYSTITVYVSIKGITDIREMLKRLTRRQLEDDATADTTNRV
jgi:hypothetical protein